MKYLQTTTAAIELGAGLALLAAPSATVVLLVGVPLAELGALVVARVAGAGLTALGVACWLARGDGRSQAACALIAAMLLYNVCVAAILAVAGWRLGLAGPALWPAVALHTVLAVWCLACLVREARFPPETVGGSVRP